MSFAQPPLQIVPHYGNYTNGTDNRYNQYGGYQHQTPEPQSSVDMAFASRPGVAHDPYAPNNATAMPSAPAPPPPSDTELALMAFEQDDGTSHQQQPAVVSPTSVQSSVVSPSASSADGPDDATLARIIASQQLAMERAKSLAPSSQIVSRSSSYDDGYSNYNNYNSGYDNSRSMTSYDMYQGQMTPYNDGGHIQTGVHPNAKLMKQQRKIKTAGGVVGGAVVGGLVLGPVGVVLGGAAGGVGAKKLAKSQEKRAQRKFEKHNVRYAAAQSRTATAATFT